MSSTTLRILMAALTVRAVTATSSVTLADFVPRIDSLPSACSVVYNQAISGCVAADFDASKQRCSAECVNGLAEISKEINKSCSIDDVSETSIVGVFLLGQGIPVLCQGVSVTTLGTVSTSKPTSSSSSSSSSTSSIKPAVTSTKQVQSKSAGAVSSSTPTSTAATNPVANPEPSSTPAPTRTPAAVQPSFVWTLSPTPSQTTSSQKSNSDSGGGSPFDVVATGSSTPRRRSSVGLTGALLGLAVLACASI
ncbi:hypothetical protein K504DRAFT_454576 [Pleomassaria siparia CBS 279.74]|uniref:Extracellular membrane protein CFEM domain-containing protein n=1 Tax=Pleomassaria siparia CBS 279.74 TaxID=1314801 RepID=A0A6G1KCQ7_9PLEO|nr:hypothetical protein K504DRAFT_454576 [Pleomassaria siparia CBS 279.74]